MNWAVGNPGYFAVLPLNIIVALMVISRIKLAERVGFEPTVPCGTLVFKTNSIDHSDTSPYKTTPQSGVLAEEERFELSREISPP